MAEVTVESTQKHVAVVTPNGRRAIAQALAGEEPVVITHMVFGDANGQPYMPDEAQTELRRQVYETEVNSVTLSDDAENCIVVDAFIPPEVGGWEINEGCV